MDQLIAKWVAGDPAAAEELYREYYQRVRGFILKRGANIVDAEDIAQEALIAGLEGLNAGRKPEHLTAWLLGIARHVSIRKFERIPEELPELVDPKRRSARSMVIRREMDRLLEQTLSRMTPNDREIVDLLYRSSLSRKEIADRLDLPLDAVQARCDRAHSRLRRSLSRHFTTVAAARLEPQPVTLEQIRALRPGFRQVITAKHLEGRTDADAALHLSLPAATFRARLESAYEILKVDPRADFSKAREAYQEECRSRREGE